MVTRSSPASNRRPASAPAIATRRMRWTARCSPRSSRTSNVAAPPGSAAGSTVTEFITPPLTPASDGEPAPAPTDPPCVPVTPRGRVTRRTRASQRLQVLDEISLLRIGQAEALERVVMVHHVEQGREPTIVIEAALHVRPQTVERRGAIAAIGRALGLEVVDADLLGGVHVPAGLGVE